MATLFVDKIDPQSGTTLSLGSSGDTLQATTGAINNIGIGMADQWRLTASRTSNGDITSNLERVDNSSFNYIGTGMTESSGIFTFPSTGIYLVTAVAMLNATNDGISFRIKATTDNSNYSIVSNAHFISNSGNLGGTSIPSSYLIDVTDTSNVKVVFTIDSMTNGNLYGDTDQNKTFFTFIRLGDT